MSGAFNIGDPVVIEIGKHKDEHGRVLGLAGDMVVIETATAARLLYFADELKVDHLLAQPA
jgi:hypothetical protein